MLHKVEITDDELAALKAWRRAQAPAWRRADKDYADVLAVARARAQGLSDAEIARTRKRWSEAFVRALGLRIGEMLAHYRRRPPLSWPEGVAALIGREDAS